MRVSAQNRAALQGSAQRSSDRLLRRLRCRGVADGASFCLHIRRGGPLNPDQIGWSGPAEHLGCDPDKRRERWNWSRSGDLVYVHLFDFDVGVTSLHFRSTGTLSHQDLDRNSSHLPSRVRPGWVRRPLSERRSRNSCASARGGVRSSPCGVKLSACLGNPPALRYVVGDE